MTEFDLNQLSKSPVFEHIKKEDLPNVLSCLKATRQSYDKGNILRSEDLHSRIGIVLEGKLAIHKFIDDGMVQIKVLELYEIFGHEYALAGLESNLYCLIAQKESTVVYFDGKKLISDNIVNCRFRSQINVNLLKELARDNLKTRQQLEFREIKSLKMRILDYLQGQKIQEGPIKIKFNRNELAEYLGVSRPALSKTLAILKEEGVLDYKKNTFIMPSTTISSVSKK